MRNKIKTFLKFLVLNSILFPNISSSQTNTNYDFIPVLPELYNKKVKEFRSENISEGSIFFVGNSIIEGGNWKKLLNNNKIINRGIGGDITYGVLNRLEEITTRKPSKVFILVGINDLSKNIPIAEIIGNYRKIINKLSSSNPDVEIYIHSLLPVNPHVKNFPSGYEKSKEIFEINERIKELSKEINIRFINLFPLFKDNQNLLKKELTTDGLHLNAGGYLIWTNFLLNEKIIDN